MPVVAWLALGFLAGYWAGRRSGVLSVMRREATAVLDSLGRMGGALHRIEGIKLAQGDSKNGIKLLVKTRQPFETLPPELYEPLPGELYDPYDVSRRGW